MWQQQFERLTQFFHGCQNGTMWKIYTTNAPHRSTQKARPIQTQFEDLPAEESLERLKQALRNQAPTALGSFVVVVVGKRTEAGGQQIVIPNPEYSGNSSTGKSSEQLNGGLIGQLLNMAGTASNSRLQAIETKATQAIEYMGQISELRTNHALETARLKRKIEDLENTVEYLETTNSTIGRVVDGIKGPLEGALVQLASSFLAGKIGGMAPTPIQAEPTNWEGWQVCEELQKEIPDLPTVLEKLLLMIKHEDYKEAVGTTIAHIRNAPIN